MSTKFLAGVAAAVVVTAIGLFAANGGSVESLNPFADNSAASPCGKKAACPLSSAAPSCCDLHGEGADESAVSSNSIGCSAATTPTTAKSAKGPGCCAE